MKCFISLGKIDKRYIYIILAFTFITIILIIIDFFKKEEDEASLMSSILINIGLSFCFIPELIRKRNISLKSKENSDLCHINGFKFQKIFVIGIASLSFLMNLLFDLLIDKLPIIEFIDIANIYYITGSFTLLILSIFLFKYNYYKHQIISIIILVVVGLFRYSLMIFELRQFYKDSKSYFILGVLIILLKNICLSFYFVYVKLLIERYYFSPYKISYLIGIINGIIILIIYLIISYIEMEDDDSLYLIEYNDKYYIDNIRNIFKGYNFIEIFLYIIYYIIYSCRFIIFNIIVQYFTLGHIIIPNQITSLMNIIGDVFINGFIKETKKKIVIVCCFIFEIFLSFVFIEFIELNFCELNKDIKKNISERASSDPNISISSKDSI